MEQLLNEVAGIIWPEAMEGKSEGLRLDQAVALDKARDILNLVQGQAMEKAVNRIAETLSAEGMYILAGEFFHELEGFATTDYGAPIRDEVDRFVYASEGLKDLDLEFEEVPA